MQGHIEQNNEYYPEAWGWKQGIHAAWAQETARPELKGLSPARVIGREHHQHRIVVPDFGGRLTPGIPQDESGRELLRAGIWDDVPVTGRFEYGSPNPADYPAVGDWALVDRDEARPRIHALLPRLSALSRGMAGEKSQEQVLAANIDTLFLVFALDGGRNFLVRLLERFLVTAWNSGATPCVLLNKVDLASPEDRERALAEAAYAAPSVPVIAVSAKTGEGLEELKAFLGAGDTVGVLGKSGVGKSALINALGAPEAREGQVREGDLRGRHTTTSSRLYRLDSGILMIDSPGIRELKVWGEAEGVDGGFPEIAVLAERCRFSDCSHAGEPGCAVQDALNTGELDPQRYLSYLELQKEQAWLERRSDERAMRAEEQKWKQIAKFQKALKRSRH